MVDKGIYFCMSQQFKRLIEDFSCEHFKQQVTGNGYTNHCPVCLWSKHVDLHPGDRASTCQGLMEPVKMEYQGDQFFVTHTCVKCGYKKKNRVASNDQWQKIIKEEALYE